MEEQPIPRRQTICYKSKATQLNPPFSHLTSSEGDHILMRVFFFFSKVDFGMSESDHLASDLLVALQGPRMSENTQRRKKELIILLWVKLYAWQFI